VESFNKQLYGVSPCTALGLLAFGGSDSIEGQANDHVCLDKFVDLQLHWESYPEVLNLRLVFDHLLNRFCEGTASAEEIENMMKLLSANTDMASSSLWRKRMVSGVKVSVVPINCDTKRPDEEKSDSKTEVMTVMPSRSLNCLAPLRSLPPCLQVHETKSRKRKRRDEYGLFMAAKDGCVRCVRQKLEEEKVNPYAQSDSNNYTVMDFAMYAKTQKKEGADAVVKYLKEYWSGILS